MTLSAMYVPSFWRKAEGNNYEIKVYEKVPGCMVWCRSDGMISHHTGKEQEWIKGDFKNNKGYWMIGGGAKWLNTFVHRAVAECFLVNPCPGLFEVVDHSNWDLEDNSAENLRYVDKQLNCMWRKNLTPKYKKVWFRKTRTWVNMWVGRVRYMKQSKYFYGDSEDEVRESMRDYQLQQFNTIYNTKISEYLVRKAYLDKLRAVFDATKDSNRSGSFIC